MARCTKIFPGPTTSRRRAIALSAGCSCVVFLIIGALAARCSAARCAGGRLIAAVFAAWSPGWRRRCSPPNRLWLRFGLLLNRIVSPVVLAFMFYVVVMPMGC